MDASSDCITSAENLTQHASVRCSPYLVPSWLLRRDSPPSHGGHEQVTVAYALEQGFGNAFDAIALAAKRFESTMNNERGIAWHAEALQ
jgi:hypothetical protein